MTPDQICEGCRRAGEALLRSLDAGDLDAIEQNTNLLRAYLALQEHSAADAQDGSDPWKRELLQALEGITEEIERRLEAIRASVSSELDRMSGAEELLRHITRTLGQGSASSLPVC